MENQLWLFAIFVSLLVVILMEAWRKSKSKQSTRNLPPGPRKLPVIGNVHQLVGSLPHHRLDELAKKYGPIMHLQLGQLSTIVISSPELAREVMTTHDLTFATRPFLLAASIIAYNRRDIAFAPYGDYWRQMKKICTEELFNAKSVQSFRSIREEEVSKLIRLIASSTDAPVNLVKMVTALSFCITSRAAFGKVSKQEDAFIPVVQKITGALVGISIADLFPSSKLLEVVSGTRSKFQRLHQEADAILEGIIREHREKRMSKNKEADDLVDVLLNLQDSDNLDFPLTIQDIKGVIMDAFLGGVDGVAATVEWAMTELMRHPRVLEKAQAEVRKVFQGNDGINETRLRDLTYLNLVIKEILRLHPPTPLLVPRETRQRVELCGYNIPEKTRVTINVRSLTRDPNHWTEPEKFYPERFLSSSVDYKGTNFEYIPFGAGRRMCPGIVYSMSIVELVLANLLYHFDWLIPDGVKPEDVHVSETFGGVVGRKNNLLLIPIPRKLK